MLFEALLYACKVFQEKEKIKKINEIIFFVEVRISNNIFMFFFFNNKNVNGVLLYMINFY